MAKKKKTENGEYESHTHCRPWNMARNTEKHGKLEMHTVGHVSWR
jgi:hypothetical protein